ncbi:MAG: hypothetical protein K6T75_02875 [Acetobacteraceae bacterium]|nr:hypothetical protein [Acetobacteraceae bacterium]
MKALGLLSGGLDSALACRLLLDQGVEVEGLHLIMPFGTRAEEGGAPAARMAERLGIKLHLREPGPDYLELVQRPRHGYGSGMNPCIDCRIYQFRLAREVMDQVGAAFLATGEVLGQRPMSQRSQIMALIDREAGVEGRVLRPLSARHLPPTLPEREGWVDRERLLDIKGRSRRQQAALAQAYSLSGYLSPAGGCLLTLKEFARRLRDFLDGGGTLDPRQVALLKVGRHFRLGARARAVVGRDQGENQVLRTLGAPGDVVAEVRGYVGPVALGLGELGPEELALLCRITARYSDAPRQGPARVGWRRLPCGPEEEVTVEAAVEEELASRRR